jgi:hypothetical protein
MVERRLLYRENCLRELLRNFRLRSLVSQKFVRIFTVQIRGIKKKGKEKRKFSYRRKEKTISTKTKKKNALGRMFAMLAP